MGYSCPKCSSPFESGTRYCKTCGCNLEFEFIENPVCPICKSNYPAGTKYCSNDGSNLVKGEDLIPRCIRCGTSYTIDVKFCPLDGGAVEMKWKEGITENSNASSIPIRTEASSSSVNKDILNDLPPSYQKASLGNRFLASILDNLIIGALCIPGTLMIVWGSMDGVDNLGYILLGVLLYLAPLVYSFIKDGLGQGQSFGKKACNLMVVNLATHQPCDKGTSFFRNFMSGLVVLIPIVGWAIEPVMVLATEDGRKLGDRAANTQVINVSDYDFSQIDSYSENIYNQ